MFRTCSAVLPQVSRSHFWGALLLIILDPQLAVISIGGEPQKILSWNFGDSFKAYLRDTGEFFSCKLKVKWARYHHLSGRQAIQKYKNLQYLAAELENAISQVFWGLLTWNKFFFTIRLSLLLNNKLFLIFLNWILSNANKNYNFFWFKVVLNIDFSLQFILYIFITINLSLKMSNS